MTSVEAVLNGKVDNREYSAGMLNDFSGLLRNIVECRKILDSHNGLPSQVLRTHSNGETVEITLTGELLNSMYANAFRMQVELCKLGEHDNAYRLMDKFTDDILDYESERLATSPE